MELIQELFFPALVAILFSFLVAKLVSVVMCGDDGESGSGLKSSKVLGEETVVETVKLDKGLTVEGAESKRGVQFVEDEVIGKVDEFKGEESVDRLGLSYQDEELADKCDVAYGTEAGKNISGAFESLEKLPDCAAVGEGAEEGVTDFEDHVNRPREMGTDPGRTDIEEKGESLSDDEVPGVTEEKAASVCMDDEEIENEEGDNRMSVGSANNDGLLHQIEKDINVECGENRVMGIEGRSGGEEKENVKLSDEDDDWEGIERSEFEKLFSKASDFVNSGGNYNRLSNIDSDAQMQLYGLQKVAMEGPCHESQPMALMVSARAKWNAWQRLGNMSPEMAMEQYINLLFDKVPGWMEGDSTRDAEASNFDPNSSTSSLEAQEKFKKKMELMPGFEGDALTGSSSPPKKDPE